MSKGLRSKGPPDTLADIQPRRRIRHTPRVMTDSAELNLGDLMKAIKDGTDVSNRIANQVDKIQSALTAMDGKLTGLTTRVDTMEQRISDVEDHTQHADSRLQKLEKEITYLTEKNIDLENRSRRFNLKIHGLPEGREGPDPIAFFETFFSNLFGSDAPLPRRIELQAAHRSPNTRPAAGRPPRNVWVCFLRLQEKNKIQQLAREKRSLTFENAKIQIFQDIPPAIQKMRKEMFLEAKTVLQDNGIVYRMRWPSSLQIDFKGKEIMCHSKEDADLFLKENNLHQKTNKSGPATVEH